MRVERKAYKVTLGVPKTKMAYTNLAAIVALLAVIVVNCKPFSDRKCFPIQVEAVMMGTVGEVMQGKALVEDVVGTLSADYHLAKQVAIENVYSGGALVSKYKIISSAVSIMSFNTSSADCTV